MIARKGSDEGWRRISVEDCAESEEVVRQRGEVGLAEGGLVGGNSVGLGDGENLAFLFGGGD